MIESLIVDGWLQARLGGDAELRAAAPGGVWADVAPEGTTGIFVVYFMTAAVDARVLGNRRILTDFVFEVRATGSGPEANYAALKPAANRIDALLDRRSGATADGTLIDATREGIVRFAEQDGGVLYRHLGGEYRIKAQGAG